jgi:hypothetical protein
MLSLGSASIASAPTANAEVSSGAVVAQQTPSSLSGVVTSSDGRPVSGARVLLFSKALTVISLTAADDGSYAVTDILPSDWFALVRPPVGSNLIDKQTSVSFQIKPGQQRVRNVTLPLGYSIEFRGQGALAAGHRGVPSCKAPGVVVPDELEFAPCTDGRRTYYGRLELTPTPGVSIMRGLPAGILNVDTGFGPFAVIVGPESNAVCTALPNSEWRCVSGDTTPPVISCPTIDPVAAGAPATTVTTKVKDNGTKSTTTATIDGSVVGVRTVTFSATDTSGNASSRTCSYEVRAQ